MKTQLIDRNWKLYALSPAKELEGKGAEAGIPGSVPGSVYSDLLSAGLIEDPYYRDNETAALSVMDGDFRYEAVFDAPEDILSEEEVLLHFDGIDTIADIGLNGTALGHTENMHRIYEYPVKTLLKPGENVLSVVLRSPTRWIKKAYAANPVEGSDDAMKGFPLLRKAHCMFGWDWGPHLPDAGIWRPVSLIGFSTARIDGVYITQNHIAADGAEFDGIHPVTERVELRFDVDVEKLGEEHVRRFGRDDRRLAGLSAEILVTSPEGKTYTGRISPEVGAEKGAVTVTEPELWWPNGLGGQPLYTVEVRLADAAGRTLDVWTRRIGLRTMTVHREKDQWGEQFCHEVNGVKVFAMGADYIPEDSILPRVTPERTRKLLTAARDANYNCVRVWGGGNYPYDAFWDICDELGLIVWQDFMFACAVYDLDGNFESEIRAEFADNIKRIRHHASLGLWCGNNEMEMFVKQRTWVTKESQVSDYVKMYEYILPHMLKELDPNTFYWPASPSSGGAFDEPNDPARGDVHYWDVWHGGRPFTAYRQFLFRYLSEFGFQSFPSVRTIESFTLPEDRNIFSPVMEKHQRNNAANGKIMNYMEQMFLYPTSFDSLVYASQLLQAEAIKYGVEHFRRNRGACMGTVVWQLNDCWPVASWASIDYFGRWKALHYYEKRAYSPLIVSCEEEGILTQNTNPNAEPYEVKKSIRLAVSNETREAVRVKVVRTLRHADSSVVDEKSFELEAPALSSVWLDREDMAGADLYGDYVSFALYRTDGGAPSDEPVSQGTVIFCTPKYFRHGDTKLAVRAENGEIVVSAAAFAKGVAIANSADDLVLSDNYFDMDAGERRVKILSGSPEGLCVRDMWSIR